jgi:hypothetical protein
MPGPFFALAQVALAGSARIKTIRIAKNSLPVPRCKRRMKTRPLVLADIVTSD